MSKKSNASHIVVFLIALLVSVATVASDGFVQAQNTNSSTTTDVQNDNMDHTNMGNTRGTRRRGRGRRRSTRARAMNDNMSAETNMSGETTTTTTQDNTDTGVTTSSSTPSDYSGTYTGRINYPEHNMTGDATLTVTGDQYTLTAGSMTHSGRFIVNTTSGYDAVTLELGPPEAGQSYAPFLSLRARRVGNGGISLTSVPGERRSFSFTTAGAGGRRTRTRRGRRNANMSEGMDANTNTNTETP